MPRSVADEHVSRIWTDKTPLRSPGDPSGRPRSPGSRGRSRAAAAAMGPLSAAHRLVINYVGFLSRDELNRVISAEHFGETVIFFKYRYPGVPV
jgi:hypothetical protein